MIITDTTEKGDGEVEETRNPPKLRIRSRYSKNDVPTSPNAPTEPLASEEDEILPPVIEERTIVNIRAALEVAENSTIPGRVYATLLVTPPNGAPFPFPIYQNGISIGRSTKVGNDLLLESDGQVSKRHARLERDNDGTFVLYDLGSTNGTRVNGALIDNRILQSGDEFVVGKTRILFEQDASAPKITSHVR